MCVLNSSSFWFYSTFDKLVKFYEDVLNKCFFLLGAWLRKHALEAAQRRASLGGSHLSVDTVGAYDHPTHAAILFRESRGVSMILISLVTLLYIHVK